LQRFAKEGKGMRSFWTKCSLVALGAAIAVVPAFAQATSKIVKTERLWDPELIQGQQVDPGKYEFIVEGNTLTITNLDQTKVIAQVTGTWVPTDTKSDTDVLMEGVNGIQQLRFEGERGMFVVNPVAQPQ
jgi:hypothetical protein